MDVPRSSEATRGEGDMVQKNDVDDEGFVPTTAEVEKHPEVENETVSLQSEIGKQEFRTTRQFEDALNEE